MTQQENTTQLHDRLMQRCLKRNPKISLNTIQQTVEETEKLYTALQELQYTISNDIVIIVGSLMDSANSIKADCLSELKKRKCYRFELKKMVKRVEEACDKYSFQLKEATREQYDFYLNSLNTIEEDVESDRQKFLYTIKGILDKHGIEDSYFQAQVALVEWFFAMARERYEKTIDLARRETIKIFNASKITCPPQLTEALNMQYGIFDPTPTTKTWHKLLNMVANFDQDIADEISHHPQIQMANSIMWNKLAEVKHVEKNLTKAKELYA